MLISSAISSDTSLLQLRSVKSAIKYIYFKENPDGTEEEINSQLISMNDVRIIELDNIIEESYQLYDETSSLIESLTDNEKKINYEIKLFETIGKTFTEIQPLNINSTSALDFNTLIQEKIYKFIIFSSIFEKVYNYIKSNIATLDSEIKAIKDEIETLTRPEQPPAEAGPEQGPEQGPDPEDCNTKNGTSKTSCQVLSLFNQS